MSTKEGMPTIIVMQEKSSLKDINILNAPEVIHIYVINIKIERM